MSGRSLTLHPKKGVNPRMTFCPRCGGEGKSLMLIGVHDKSGKCPTHGRVYGAQFRCPAKGCGNDLTDVRTITESERLPDSQPCTTCEAEIKAHADIVAQGGVYWRCTECKKAGVIKPCGLTEDARRAAQVETPNPLGIEFAACKEHQPTGEAQ